MTFLADENVPTASVRLLRAAGHEVAHITESHAGIPDRAVLRLAREQNCVLLTFDRDFGELIFRHGETPPPAVVFLRFVPATPTEAAERVLAALQAPGVELHGNFSVLTREEIRQRRLV